MSLTTIIRSALLGAALTLGCSGNRNNNQGITVNALRATTNSEGIADFPGTEQDITVLNTAENPLPNVHVTAYQVHKNGRYEGDVYLARTQLNEGGMNVYLQYDNRGAYLLTERLLTIRRSRGLTSFDREFRDVIFDLQRWSRGESYSCEGMYTTAELIAGRERAVRLISYIDPTDLVEQAYDKVEWLIDNGFLQDLSPDKEWFVLTAENPTVPSELLEKGAARYIFSREEYSRLERACGQPGSDGGIADDGSIGRDSGSRPDGGPAAMGIIAFDSHRDGSIDIYRMNTDGSNVIRITTRPSLQPAWSPDGRRIAFTRDNEIYVMNADGTNPVNLTSNPAHDSEPAWSPNGLKIAFKSNRDGDENIYTMNSDGSNQIRLTTNPASDQQPAWSPDGTQIAYTSYPGIVQREIYAMNADGSNQRNLTNHPEGENTSPAWSPNGRTILFISGRGGSAGAYTMRPDGSNQTRIIRGYGHIMDPAWSPDGEYLSFSADVEGNFEIYSARADGSNVLRLTNHTSDDTAPAWSPR